MTSRPAKSLSETFSPAGPVRVNAGAFVPGSSMGVGASAFLDERRRPLDPLGGHWRAFRQPLLTTHHHLLRRFDPGPRLDEARSADTEIDLATGRLALDDDPDVVRALQRDDGILRDDHGLGPNCR